MNNNTETATKLANSLAAYLKVDNEKELQATNCQLLMHTLEENIEDTLTRLEELESGIKMLQAEREKFGTCDFTTARCKLNTLCQRIHKLDEMSKKVLQDVEALEPVVDEAEANLVNSAENKLRSMLKPLFFMRSDAPCPSTRGPTTPQFIPQPHFKTSSFFPKNSDNESFSPSSS